MILNAGSYRRETLPPALLGLLPADLTAEWGTVIAAQDKWAAARDELPALDAAADRAKHADDEAAVAAVAAGKPIPKPTIEATRTAADTKRREVQALAVIADDAERTFIHVTLPSRWDEIAAQARAAVDRAVDAAVNATIEAEARVHDIAAALAIWEWDTASSSLPRGGALYGTVGGQDMPLAPVLGQITDLLNRYRPDSVEARRAERQRVINEQAGIRATPDGLMVDVAASRAYNR